MNNRDSMNPETLEQTVRAAWLYYVAGNTQEQTAEFLGISRVKVNRLLAEAKDSGIVKISIEHRFARMVEVEEMIRSRYKLLFCRATPPLLSSPRAEEACLRGRNWRRRPRLLGELLVLSQPICFANDSKADENSVVAVGFGRTIAEVPSYLVGMSKPKVKFVSAMGSLTRSSAANPFEVVCHFAEKTGGEGHLLPVPFYSRQR